MIKYTPNVNSVKKLFFGKDLTKDHTTKSNIPARSLLYHYIVLNIKHRKKYIFHHGNVPLAIIRVL